jgi:ferritin-like metal-binding protein YciE
MRLENLQDLYVEQIEDLYSAEQQLIKALPQMAKAATNPHLKNAFINHLEQTKDHVQRLQGVFSALELKPKNKTCKAMEGLIEEGDEMIREDGNYEVKDAGLIACAQRIEHYEIAAYGTARTFANTLGYHEAARLLQLTLNEEGEADKLLTLIATTVINPTAAVVPSAS